MFADAADWRGTPPRVFPLSRGSQTATFEAHHMHSLAVVSLKAAEEWEQPNARGFCALCAAVLEPGDAGRMRWCGGACSGESGCDLRARNLGEREIIPDHCCGVSLLI